MRTQSEIVAEIKRAQPGDFFGFYTVDLVGFLDFEHAKPFLKPETTAEQWKQDKHGKDDIIAAIKDYMAFAWDKANNCRGISAGRSINHMRAWLWMLGEDRAAKAIDDYTLYGKPQLAAICEHFGIDWQALDDGEWVNDEQWPSCAKVIAKLDWNEPAAQAA